MRFRDFLLQQATEKVDERIAAFWASVNKRGTTMPYMATECWEWKGTGANRESFWVGQRLERPRYVAWRLERGGVPVGQQVLSMCDNIQCVRPDHLTLGLHTERADESTEPISSRSHLTESEIVEARKLLTSGKTSSFVARKFDVPPSTISYIRLNKDWAGR